MSPVSTVIAHGKISTVCLHVAAFVVHVVFSKPSHTEPNYFWAVVCMPRSLYTASAQSTLLNPPQMFQWSIPGSCCFCERFSAVYQCPSQSTATNMLFKRCLMTSQMTLALLTYLIWSTLNWLTSVCDNWSLIMLLALITFLLNILFMHILYYVSVDALFCVIVMSLMCFIQEWLSRY